MRHWYRDFRSVTRALHIFLSAFQNFSLSAFDSPLGFPLRLGALAPFVIRYDRISRFQFFNVSGFQK